MRLKLKYWIDSSGNIQELILPVCEKIADLSITNSISKSSIQTSAGYKTEYGKQVNRTSPVTITGIICDDKYTDATTSNNLGYYLYALNHLQKSVYYSFNQSYGMIDIKSIEIENTGQFRKFTIQGSKSC